MSFHNAISPASDQQQFTVLGDYYLGERLGAGCFSSVYLAVHIHTGLSVAIKVISKEKSDKKTVESEIAAMLLVRGHRYIVQLYEVLEDANHVYMVLEYCAGGNLHEYLVKNGPICEWRAAFWIAQLAAALNHCHCHGVVNRDVKNANIFISNNNLKLGDFGLAHISQDQNTQKLWCATGSPVFAAPEVYATSKGLPYDGPRSEAWALGCVLHSMLTARLPFSISTYHRDWAVYKPPETASAPCQTLLVALFNMQPALRPSMSTILKHDFIVANVLYARVCLLQAEKTRGLFSGTINAPTGPASNYIFAQGNCFENNLPPIVHNCTAKLSHPTY